MARREAPSGERYGEGVSSSPVWGSGGVTPGKILKHEVQFGAIWCILATNWRFSCLPPLIVNENIAIMLDMQWTSQLVVIRVALAVPTSVYMLALLLTTEAVKTVLVVILCLMM